MTGFEKFCLKLIRRGPRLLSFWGLCPSADPQWGALSLDFHPSDHDSMQAG